MHSKFCDILQHVLLHIRDISSICSLLQVSTAVRHTVQSCRAQCCITSAVDLHGGGDLEDPAELGSLRQHAAAMRWLPRHAGLVSDLQLYACSEGQAMVAYTLLEQALQLCAQYATQHTQGLHATEAAAAAPAATTAAAAVVDGRMAAAHTGSSLQDAAPGPLRLHGFTTDSPAPPAVLCLLQSAGLQSLNLTLGSAEELADVPASFYPALAGMQGLKELSLAYIRHSADHPFPVPFASAVGQLNHLTYLTADNLTPAGARLLPASLRRFVLLSPYKDSSEGTDSRSAAADDDPMSLSHLTALSSLHWQNYEGELCDVTLPQQPVRLESTGRLHLVGSHNLPDVSICTRGAGEHGLEVLLQLPASPHTCALKVNLDDIEVLSPGTLHNMGTALGALTKLTSLTFATAQTQAGRVSSLPYVQFVQQLRKLPSLVELSLTFQDFGVNQADVDRSVDACGMLQLLALTSLTKLKVTDYAGAGLNDLAASAVAVSLTRLQQLDLTSHGILTWSAVPAIARLTGLRSLELYTQAKAASQMQAVLQQLTALTLLTHLGLSLPLDKLSEAERQHFLAGMPFLARIN